MKLEYETLEELYNRLNALKETHIWTDDFHVHYDEVNNYELVEVEEKETCYWIILKEKGETNV